MSSVTCVDMQERVMIGRRSMLRWSAAGFGHLALLGMLGAERRSEGVVVPDGLQGANLMRGNL